MNVCYKAQKRKQVLIENVTELTSQPESSHPVDNSATIKTPSRQLSYSQVNQRICNSAKVKSHFS